MSDAKKKIVCIIQARMGSKRLPGKVMKKIAGIPCINRVIKRVKKSENINQIWLATTKKKEDNILEAVAKKFKIECFKGSTNNVLSRFYNISKISNGDYFVRITADCPLIDYQIIDKAINLCIKKELDYVSNTLDRTYPDGLDVEVFSKSSLLKAYKQAKHPFHLEHVTPYIHGKVPKIIPRGKFNKLQIKNNINYSNLRWTLDEKKDLTFLNKLCKLVNYDANWIQIRVMLEKKPFFT